jgi:hypothetical protein
MTISKNTTLMRIDFLTESSLIRFKIARRKDFLVLILDRRHIEQPVAAQRRNEYALVQKTGSGMVSAVRRLPMQQPNDAKPVGVKKDPRLGRARGFRALSSWWLPFLRGGSYSPGHQTTCRVG